MYELAYEEYAVMQDGGTTSPQYFYQSSYYQETQVPPEPPPTTETEFVVEVTETLTSTGGTISPVDLSLITPAEWEAFLAELLGFVTQTRGGDQNSNYYDHSDEAPLGEHFIQEWGWLPSIQRLPGYHYYDYLTQDIDPEFLEMAYGAHLGENFFTDAGVSLTTIENMPFQVYVQGTPITVVWHSGTAPVSNLATAPGQPGDIVVTASLGYFTVHADPPGPSTGSSETPPTGINLMEMTEANAPYIRFLDQALQYLIQDPLALQVLMQAYQLGIKITIVTGAAETRFNETTQTVEWNPGMGLRLTNGGIMSPAMGLIHEIAHRIVALYGADAQYGTLEERYIIENYEQIIGQRLGEPTRSDHYGDPVYVPSVTYHTPPPS